MKYIRTMVDDQTYKLVRQYHLDQNAKGRKLKIGEALNELLQKALAATPVSPNSSSPPPVDG